jgi:energy-coupling factor transporter ATP-binding protein EcfA2
MFDQKIVVSEMLDVLLLAYKQKVSTLFLGPAGCGKSAIGKIFANIIAPNQPNNLLDIRLCMKSIEQVGGLLMPRELKNGSFVLQTALPEEYECLFDPNYKGVLLFDEFTSTLPSLQNVMYQVALDRILGGRKISDCVAVCMFGNLHTNGGKTYNILKPILNRVKAYEIDSNSEAALEDWLNTFAYHSNIHPAFIGFLEQNPSLLNTNDVDNKPNQPFMSGRSIEAASKDLYAIEQGEISERLGWISINGLLNESHAADFKKYYRIGFDLPKSTDILNGKGSVLKEWAKEPNWPTLIKANTSAKFRS